MLSHIYLPVQLQSLVNILLFHSYSVIATNHLLVHICRFDILEFHTSSTIFVTLNAGFV